MSSTEFRFDLSEVKERAARLLHAELPPSGSDLSVPALRSDDDLNPHLEATAEGKPPRLAAVLVPLLKHAAEVTVLMTHRTEHLSNHAGQVAFPGGKIDDGDTDAVETALREAQEETGLDRAAVEPLGFLDPYQTRSGFRIVPVVALVEADAALEANPDEVQSIFQVPLSFLMNPANHQLDRRAWRGTERVFYAMPFEGHYIWGVTAGVLRNFYERMYEA